MRSENEDVDWAPVEGLDGVVAVYDLLEGTDRLYAGVRGEDKGRVYQSDLEGLSWARTGELPHSDIKAVHCLLQGPLGEIFAGTEMRMGPSFTRVFVTQSQEAHWQEFGGPIDLANTVYALIGTSDMVYAGTGRVYGNVYKCALQAARPHDIYLPLVVRNASTPSLE